MLKVFVCAMVWGDNDKNLREKENDKEKVFDGLSQVFLSFFF